jgi:hypothetical protein
MDTKTFNELAIKLVKHNFYDLENDKDVALQTVWQTHLLGNKKAILCDLNPDNNFLYEVTYNGFHNEFYVDKYDKLANAVCVADLETMTVCTSKYTKLRD